MTMRLGFIRASVVVLVLTSVSIQAQQPGKSANSYDVLRGHDIEDPENISGEWETSLNGAVYGMQIELTTRINGAPVTLLGARQTFHHALIEVYERTGPTRKPGEGNWFSDDSLKVKWTRKRLTINQDGTTQGPAINLDLAFDPIHSSWSGRFRQGSFDRKVTLVRPCCAEKNAASPLVGTWARNAPSNNCIHIAQGQDGSLVSWSDDLQTPGAYLYANGIQPPRETFEHYGTVANTTFRSPSGVAIEFNPLSPLCCPVQFVGRDSATGKSIVPAADGPGPMAHWVLMKGNSCVRR
jgi:hypothetical protein